MASGNTPSVSDLLNMIVRGSITAGRSLFSSLFKRLSYPLLFFGTKSFISSLISVLSVGLRKMHFSFCGMLFRYSEISFEEGGILLANVSPVLEKCLQNSLVMVAGSYLGTPSMLIALILSPLLGVLFSISCISFQSL